jgi:hypothetical protein
MGERGRGKMKEMLNSLIGAITSSITKKRQVDQVENLIALC